MEFQHGPFVFIAHNAGAVAGRKSLRWQYNYGSVFLSEKILPASATKAEIIGAFAHARADFIREEFDEHAPDVLDLVDSETDETVGRLRVIGDVGLTPGLIDDRSKYWLRSNNRLRSRAVTLTEFAAIAARHAAPDNCWVTGLLPDETLTEDPDEWRPPTSWEIRHVVGEGSFTGPSGAKAAAIVGVAPQNFRKYTASGNAKHRQQMSFAMWHLLLHKLDIKRLGPGQGIR